MGKKIGEMDNSQIMQGCTSHGEQLETLELKCVWQLGRKLQETVLEGSPDGGY